MTTIKSKIMKNLQLPELFFRELITNLDAVFWIASPRIRKIIYVSPQYETIWGRSCESLYQNPKDWTDAIVPKDRQRVQDDFIVLKEQKNECVKCQYDIMRPDGTIRTILDQGFQIRDKKGNVVGQMGIASDITEILWTQNNITIQNNFREIFIKNKELKSSLKGALSDICHFFKWDLGQLWILDSDKNTLNHVYSWAQDEIIIDPVIEKNANQTVKRGVDILGWVWEQNAPIWLINLDEYRNYSYLQKFVKFNLKTVLILPIYFSGNTYGIIELYAKNIFKKEKILQDIYSAVSTVKCNSGTRT